MKKDFFIITVLVLTGLSSLSSFFLIFLGKFLVILQESISSNVLKSINEFSTSGFGMIILYGVLIFIILWLNIGMGLFIYKVWPITISEEKVKKIILTICIIFSVIVSLSTFVLNLMWRVYTNSDFSEIIGIVCFAVFPLLIVYKMSTKGWNGYKEMTEGEAG